MLENNSSKVPISVKADAYDQLCKAYMEGVSMKFDIFGRREGGFQSVDEYVGYAFGKMAFNQGAISNIRQAELPI